MEQPSPLATPGTTGSMISPTSTELRLGVVFEIDSDETGKTISTVTFAP
jgi:hypothetical protein